MTKRNSVVVIMMNEAEIEAFNQNVKKAFQFTSLKPMSEEHDLYQAGIMHSITPFSLTGVYTLPELENIFARVNTCSKLLTASEFQQILAEERGRLKKGCDVEESKIIITSPTYSLNISGLEKYADITQLYAVPSAKRDAYAYGATICHRKLLHKLSSTDAYTIGELIEIFKKGELSMVSEIRVFAAASDFQKEYKHFTVSEHTLSPTTVKPGPVNVYVVKLVHPELPEPLSTMTVFSFIELEYIFERNYVSRIQTEQELKQVCLDAQVHLEKTASDNIKAEVEKEPNHLLLFDTTSEEDRLIEKIADKMVEKLRTEFIIKPKTQDEILADILKEAQAKLDLNHSTVEFLHDAIAEKQQRDAQNAK